MIQLNLNPLPSKPIPLVKRNWDEYQNAVIKEIAEGKGNLIVDAVAGSGKSTVIVQGAALLPNPNVIKFLVFNVEAASELIKRGVNASTFHSMLVPMCPYELNTSKTFALLKLVRKDLLPATARYIRLLGFGKNAGIGADPELPNIPDSWEEVLAHYGVDTSPHEIENLRELLDMSVVHMAKLGADFDDLLWLAARGDIDLPRYETLFIDEAQDTNGLQRAIIMRYRLRGTRIIAVGDQGQALYGFRGAGTDSMNQLQKLLQAKRLPMLYSYRCLPGVSSFARNYGMVKSAPHLQGGEVINVKYKWEPGNFPDSCYVVSRTNATITGVAIKLVVAGKLVNVRNYSKSAVARVLKDGNVDKWLADEVRKARLAQDYVREQEAQDTAESVRMLLNVGVQLNLTPPQIAARFTSTNPKAIQLLTIHGIKGLEADVVVWVNHEHKCLPEKPKKWQEQQEVNAQYVAATRARRKLVIIKTSEDSNKPKPNIRKEVRDLIKDYPPNY